MWTHSSVSRTFPVETGIKRPASAVRVSHKSPKGRQNAVKQRSVAPSGLVFLVTVFPGVTHRSTPGYLLASPPGLMRDLHVSDHILV